MLYDKQRQLIARLSYIGIPAFFAWNIYQMSKLPVIPKKKK